MIVRWAQLAPVGQAGAIGLCYAHVACMLVAPYIGAFGAPLRRLGFWMGVSVALLEGGARLAREAREFDWVLVLVCVGVGNGLAWLAFGVADYSLVRGSQRIVRFYRVVARSGVDLKAWTCFTLVAGCEELVWRGVLQTSLGGDTVAAVLVAAGFAGAHTTRARKLRIPALADLMVLSMACSLATIWSGVLIPAVVLHTVRNVICHTVRLERDPRYRDAVGRWRDRDRTALWRAGGQ